MKCDICGENEAIVHVEQIIGDEKTEIHLCRHCAQDKGITDEDDKLELSIAHLIGNLIYPKSTKKATTLKKKCPFCGKTINEFKKDGRLGCPECYSSFHKEIDEHLKKNIGKVKHKGKVPESLRNFKQILIDREQLKQKLKQAIIEENYEEAAQIRDKIREIEGVADNSN